MRSRMRRGKTTLEQTETEMAGSETGHRTKRGWKKGENKSSVEKELWRRRRQARRTTTPTAVSARKRDQGDGSPAPEKESQHRTGKENSCERTLKETYAGKGEEEEARWGRRSGGLAVIGPPSRSDSRYRRKPLSILLLVQIAVIGVNWKQSLERENLECIKVLLITLRFRVNMLASGFRFIRSRLSPVYIEQI